VDWGPWFFASDDCKSRPFVRNDTLWAEGVLLAKDFRFFFCGDTGYSPVFKEIGDKYGPFDLSAIPIGAYAPRWFMRHYHITPEEAARSTWMCAPKNPLPSTVNPINRMRAGSGPGQRKLALPGNIGLGVRIQNPGDRRKDAPSAQPLYKSVVERSDIIRCSDFCLLTFLVQLGLFQIGCGESEICYYIKGCCDT
jgi:hypothetical protein